MYLVNGKEESRISLQDRAVQYGDGLFETFAIHAGKILCWDEHFKRLQLGCNKLGISCPAESLLLAEINKIDIKNDKAVLKIVISRGEGGRGYLPPQTCDPTRIISIHDWPVYPEKPGVKGIDICLCETRLGHNPMLAGIKHLNRLEQVLIGRELQGRGYMEGLVLDIDDNVIEGMKSNVFIVKGKQLATPAIINCGIAGVIRQQIIAWSNQSGMPCEECELSIDEVMDADEIFFCNSIIGIWPVKKIDHKNINVGPVSNNIREHLQQSGLIAK